MLMSNQINSIQFNSDMCLFIYFDSVRPRGFHKTSQTGIDSDMRLFIHFNSVKLRGFHKTSHADWY